MESNDFTIRAGIPDHCPVPPGGWRFVVPSGMSLKLSGTEIKAGTAVRLFEEVSRIFVNNGEPFSQDEFLFHLREQFPEET